MDFKEFKKKFEKITVKEYPNEVNQTPIVSVCVQTFNQENFIEQCIESILIQKTNFPFEILLADDDSNDNTKEICSFYAGRNPHKVRYFKHSRINNIKVLGRDSANFAAIYNFFSAKGKYIAICEGDDFWGDPFKLQKQYDFMISNPQYSVCYHDFKPVNYLGIKINTEKVSPLKRNLKAKELLYPWIHPATLTVFFKNVLRSIPKEATEVLTLDVFLYTILGNFGPGKYLENIVPSFYRIQENSLWANRSLDYKLLNKINTYNKISEFYKQTNRKKIAGIFRRRGHKLKAYIIFYNVRKLIFRT